MAKLPDPIQRRVPGAVRPLAQVSEKAAAAPGMELSRLGQTITDVGINIQDREDTAAVKERDAYVSGEIRKVLYDPETGFSNLYGKDAVARRADVLKRLDGIAEAAKNGLSKSAQRKFDTTLQSRIEGAKQRVDVHTSGERRTWLNGASEARMASAAQDALFTGVDPAFALISSELRQQAGREGWDAARLDFELKSKKSDLIANQAIMAAQKNPVAALDYVNEHAEELAPDRLLRLKATLEPEAKKYQGRRLGAAAAAGPGVSVDYLANIRAAESGGNDLAKNARSSATGRYQFTSGTWAEMMRRHPELGLTPDGRTDPLQQEIAIRAFTAGNAQTLKASGIEATGGNLYAAHFLGAGGAKTVLQAAGNAALEDLLPAGVISANPFLKGMSVDRFKAWADRKGGVGVGYSDMTGPDDILNISDPDVRKAALEEYSTIVSVKQGQRKLQMAAAEQSAFEVIEAGTDPASLPLDIRQTLGIDTMSSLRTYYGKIAAGQPVATDPKTYVELRQLKASDPQGFRDVNILEYADRLSLTDLKSFADEQAKPVDPANEFAASSLMSTAQRQLRAAGVKANTEEDAAVQSRLLAWQDRFVAENKRRPTQKEINERVGQELVPVVVDPRGLMNKESGSLYSEDFSVPITDEEDILKLISEDGVVSVDGEELPAFVTREIVMILNQQSGPVTVQRIIDTYLELKTEFE